MIFYLSKQGQKTILLSSSAPVIFYLILCLVNRFSNIMTIIFIIKFYKIDSFIRIRSRLFQVISFSYYSKHTTTVCHDLSVFLCGSCVEYIVTFSNFHRLIQQAAAIPAKVNYRAFWMASASAAASASDILST